ncbi:hypothetical protein ACFYOV_20505 [Streptomyces sp. NPDC005931]|uniref:hypothetical protein n=1 Tax=Streptomyces sp. NPDC005931 TaxID=3364737 RepID=UPI00367A0A4E
MTQSGQGEEPSAPPAREGIVLPSDGGEPVLPGVTGGPGAGPRADRTPGSAPPGAPTPDGQWSHGPQQSPPPAPAQDWQSPPAGQWGAQNPAPWGARHAPGAGQAGPGPLPPEGAPPSSRTGAAAHGRDGGASASLPQPGAHGAAPSAPRGAAGSHGVPGHGQQGPGGGLPPRQGGAAYGAPAAGGAYGPPSGTSGAPLPPVSPEGATQYLPPVPGGPEGATQYLPPVAAAPDEGATQYIPPAGPGALPPEAPAEHDSETTRYLGLPARGGPRAGAGPLPPAGHGPDAEATQYIAPVTDGPAPYGAPSGDGNRQPPAEFDNLFRSEGAHGPAGATQQLPRVDAAHPARPSDPYAHAPSGPGGGRRAAYGEDEGGRGGRGRTGSRVPLIAAIGVGIAVLGIGAGALLAGGGGNDDGGPNQPVSATAPASQEPSSSPSADPARQQAVELDKLLADSGDSRTAVINAVADVKACRNLTQAAKDLRDAARQRTQLVTDLSGLSVDKLPDNAALTTALTKAWRASASADNHYAAWADQVAGQKSCKKGQARSTGETQAGNRASGTATTEKAKAAPLWNAIAREYGLTERRPTQL